MDVMSKLREVGALFSAKEYGAALDKLHDIWAGIPEPKVNTPNAYLVLEYGVACSIKAGDLDEAQEWASQAPNFAQKRQDQGEVEFLIGKVAFARGELEAARANFFVANEKSKGRVFEGEDSKYKEFIK